MSPLWLLVFTRSKEGNCIENPSAGVNLHQINHHFSDKVLNVWLHRPDSRLESRKQQSYIARQLLQVAFSKANISLPGQQLAQTGVSLIVSIREQFGLEISITHCPQMVAIAIGHYKLGLDCEALGKKRDWCDIASQFFSSEEALNIRMAKPHQRERLFLQHWTLKEAYIKSNQQSIFGALNWLTLSSGEEVKLNSPYDIKGNAWRTEINDCILSIFCQSNQISAPLFLECTDLSSGTFTSLNEDMLIKHISTGSIQ
jgi:phosphopantetheinyl transferase